MTGHTKEPWPYFIDWCEPSSPHPDSEGIVRLGFEDYRRARACVNACSGVSNGELALTTMSVVLARMNKAEQRRDELLAAMERLLPWAEVMGGVNRDVDYTGDHPLAISRAAMAAARGER